MASFMYNRAKKELLDGTVDLVADTIKVMLVTSSYVADKDHDFVDEAGANLAKSPRSISPLSSTSYSTAHTGVSGAGLTGVSGTENCTFDRPSPKS